MKFVSSCILLVLLFSSCHKDKREKTIIAGEIVNPTSAYLTLIDRDEVVDTIPIQKNGQFYYEFKQDHEKLYLFKHDPEVQSIYLKPGDSTVFRLNTVEFDESLTYGGDTGVENNFFVETFLLNESNNDVILSYYKINPEEYEQITDSIHQQRISDLNTLQRTHNLSNYFLRIAKKSIDYEYFDMRERYAFLNHRYFSERKLPTNYFEYRDQVDFNDEDLYYYFGYLRFLDNYLKNISVAYCKENMEEKDCFNLNTYDNLSIRVDFVNKIFDNNVLRKRFLKRFISQEIIFAETEAQIQETLNSLEDFDFSEQEKADVRRLANFHQQFLVGEKIGDLELYNVDKEKKTFREFASAKPMVVHIWSGNSSEMHQNRFKKINELRKKYPEVDFIGINIDFENPVIWHNVLFRNAYNTAYEYQLADFKNYGDLYSNYLNKIFFVDSTCKIQQGKTLLSSQNFESELLEFLNSKQEN
ncbi:MAG: TlpA family protein disulfide reductase [Bacteroidota bacterium]